MDDSSDTLGHIGGEAVAPSESGHSAELSLCLLYEAFPVGVDADERPYDSSVQTIAVTLPLKFVGKEPRLFREALLRALDHTFGLAVIYREDGNGEANTERHFDLKARIEEA